MKSDAYGDTISTKIYGEYDGLYQETPTNTSEYSSPYPFFESNDNKWMSYDHYDPHLITVAKHWLPVGEKNNTFYMPYYFFDFKRIPTSDIWNSVTIDSVVVNAFVNGDKETSTNKTFLAINYMNGSYWSDPSEKINASNRFESDPFGSRKLVAETPRSNFSAMVTVVVDKHDLPKTYSWDLTDLASTMASAHSITLLFTGYPVEVSTMSDNMLYFYSGIELKNEYYIGKTVVPSITITYTKQHTILGSLMDTSTMLTAVSVISPIAAWFYRKNIMNSTKRFLKR